MSICSLGASAIAWQDGPVSGDFVLTWSTGSVPEGEIARARLEAEGIPVLLKGEGEGPYRMGPVHLWVPAEFEVQARAILDEPLEPISDEELATLAEEAGEEN
jgi:hypothetical protein